MPRASWGSKSVWEASRRYLSCRSEGLEVRVMGPQNHGIAKIFFTAQLSPANHVPVCVLSRLVVTLHSDPAFHGHLTHQEPWALYPDASERSGLSLARQLSLPIR